MAETSLRLLQLLAALQAHHTLAGNELAGRLGVTTRTVRRDVERLRELGYPVESVQGTAGYRLGQGTRLPPLVLDDDEAVAVVLGLRAAARYPVTGVEAASVQALAKLEQVLPSRLRYRVSALAATTSHVWEQPSEPPVSPEVLLTIADACRRRERLRFAYTSPHSGASRRDVEPHRLVLFSRRWYLVAFDVSRDEWRTFRVDRLTPRSPTGPGFGPRPVPHGDAVEFLAHQLSAGTWRCRAVVRLAASAGDLAERTWPGMGVLEPEGEGSCLLHVGAPTVRELLWMITSVDADFELVEAPAGLASGLRVQAERCRAAASGPA